MVLVEGKGGGLALRYFSICYEYEDFSWNMWGLNDLWQWSILRIYMCNLKGDVVCFSRNEKNLWLRSLLGVLFFLGWGRGFYLLDYFVKWWCYLGCSSHAGWWVVKKIDVDIGQYSVSCLFNVEKDSFYQTIPSFHLKKKTKEKKKIH